MTSVDGGRRGVIVVAGPAVGHRAGVAAAVAEAARRGDVAVVTDRWEPRSAPSGGGRAASLAHAFAEAARYRSRMALRWRRAARDGIVVVEGSWLDLVLGAKGRRLPEELFAAAMTISLAAPRADLAVVVDEHRQDRHRPAPDSNDWTAWTWSQLAWAVAPRSVRVSPPAGDAAVAAAVLEALAGPPLPDTARWVRPLVARPARDLRATVGSDARAALGTFKSRVWSARLGLAVNAALVARAIAPPVVPPVDDLAGLCASIGVEARAFATVRSAAPGRRTIGVSAGGRLHAVLKVGPALDEGLRREADALVRLAAGEGSLPVPSLLWTGQWAGRYVVATSALPNRGVPRRLPAGDVVDVCVRLASAGPSATPVVHGDVARWNFVLTPTGLGLVDWENARFEDDPLYDLAHFVIQEGALLGRLNPSQALDLLVADGSAGTTYLRLVGLAPELARSLVASYLTRAPRRGPFHAEMERLLERR